MCTAVCLVPSDFGHGRPQHGASMRARSAGVIMIPTILNSVCRWGNGMLVRQKLVVPERDGVNFEVWPEAIELGRMFAAEGYELALVGGPVRDLLLHRKSHDWIFAHRRVLSSLNTFLRRFGCDGFGIWAVNSARWAPCAGVRMARKCRLR